MTVSGTCVPPGPSNRATGRPRSSMARAGKRRRSASTSNATIGPRACSGQAGRTASRFGLAVDRSGSRSRRPPWVSGGAAHRLPGRDGDLVVPRRLDAIEADEDLRPLRGIEEVGGAEMLVPGAEAGVDARGADADLAAGVRSVALLDLERSVDVAEGPSDSRDHHVLGREGDVGVRGVEAP